jgi:hypothetical protein
MDLHKAHARPRLLTVFAFILWFSDRHGAHGLEALLQSSLAIFEIRMKLIWPASSFCVAGHRLEQASPGEDHGTLISTRFLRSRSSVGLLRQPRLR